MRFFIAFLSCIVFLKNANTSPHDYSYLLEKSQYYRTLDSEKSLKFALGAVNDISALDDDSLKAFSLKNLGLAYYFNHNYKEALQTFDVALVYYEKLSDSVGISSCYNSYGFIYKDLQLFQKAELYFKKSLEIDFLTGDVSGKAVVYNNLGELYHLQHRYYLALHYYFESLKLEKQLKNLDGIAESYNNIATVYSDNMQYNTALVYYDNAKRLYLQTKNIFRLGQVFNNIGVTYYLTDAYHKAHDAFKTSLQYKINSNDVQGLMTSLLNLGNVYVLMSDTAKANDVYVQAIKLDNEYFAYNNDSVFDDELNKLKNYDDLFFYMLNSDVESGYYHGVSERLFYRGKIHFSLGDYDVAIPFFINSIETASYNDSKPLLLKNFKYISEAYHHCEDFKNAAIYAQKYVSLSDSINLLSFKDFSTLYSGINYGEDFFTSTFNNVAIADVRSDNLNTELTYWFYISIIQLVVIMVLVSMLLKTRRKTAKFSS